MKKAILILGVFAALCFCSCGKAQKQQSSVYETTKSVQTETLATEPSTEPPTDVPRERQRLSSEFVPFKKGESQRWMSVDIPQAGLKNLYVGNMETGHAVAQVKNESNLSLPVYIFCDYEIYDYSLCHISYLAVMTDSGILFREFETPCYSDSLYLCDVDGDQLDEIIVQQLVGISGGAGQYASHVFKVSGNEIKEIFSSKIADEKFDTGYSSKLLKDFRIEIKNSPTGYSEIFDLDPEKYINWYYDENGDLIKDSADIMIDSFYDFSPEDTDGDGVYEILCRQYVSLLSHMDGLGAAESVLKYNTQTGKFEVIDAKLVRYDRD